jgi:hypothetical protein
MAKTLGLGVAVVVFEIGIVFAAPVVGQLQDLAGVSLMGISPLLAGKISFDSSANGSAAHLTTELWKAMTKTDMMHIPLPQGGTGADRFAGRADTAVF